MVNKLFEHIGTKVVLANPWLDTYSVNCIELPLKDGEKRIVNIEGDEKEDFSINDISGNGFYIKINPRFTYTEQRQVSSSQKDFLVSIRFRFVFFGINTEIEYSKLGLENKFGTAFRNISFSDYIGNERSIKLNISQTNIDAVQIFKEEVGKDYDFGAESVFIALDGVLSFMSTDNYCDSECGIAVSESTLKTLDFCDPAIIALLNAKQRECLENEFGGGGGISCDDVAACPVITEIQTDLATETSERISEDAALLALIQAIQANPTLAQVLANGNLTNEQAISSNNGYATAELVNSQVYLRWFNANYNNQLGLTDAATYLSYYNIATNKLGLLYYDDANALLQHSTLIKLAAPLINLPQGTASKVLKLDANKNIVFIDDANGLTLQQVINNGSNLNGLLAESNDTFSKVYVEDGDIDLYYNNGVKLARIVASALSLELTQTDLIKLSAPTINLPQGTASSIVETDASKNLTYAAKGTAYNKNFGTTAGTVLEGNRITQTITNGVTDKVPSEDAVYDALALKANLTDSRFPIRTSDTTRYTNTGDTNENVLTSLLISAGSYTGKAFEVYIKTITSNGANNKTFRIYFNSTADLTGSPVLAATYTATTAGGNFSRKFKDLGTTIKNYIAPTTSFSSFEPSVTTTATENTLAVNLTTAKYIVITAQNQISGERAIVDFCYTQNIT